MTNKIVVPGELVSDRKNQGENIYVDNEKTYSSVLGLLYEQDSRIVPLNGPYIPKNDDYVVGIVKECKFAGYTIDIKSPYDAFLSSKECRLKLSLGDVLFGMLKEVDEVNNSNISRPRQLTDGLLVEIPPVKVPRVIGKKSSMVNMIVKSTDSEIYVGKNGRIWIRGGNSSLASRAIAKIGAEAHVPGLTDRIKEFLDSETKRK